MPLPRGERPVNDTYNATRGSVRSLAPIRDISRRVTVAHHEQPLSDVRAEVQTVDRSTGDGKLLFIWGLCGFTADELNNDRWVMV